MTTKINVKEAVLVCEAIVEIDGEERALQFSPTVPENIIEEMVKAQATALIAAGADNIEPYKDDQLDQAKPSEYPY